MQLPLPMANPREGGARARLQPSCAADSSACGVAETWCSRSFRPSGQPRLNFSRLATGLRLAPSLEATLPVDELKAALLLRNVQDNQLPATSGRSRLGPSGGRGNGLISAQPSSIRGSEPSGSRASTSARVILQRSAIS